MWPYVKPYWFRALLAVLICIPIGSLDAVIALSLKPYMDLVMVEKTIESPWYIPFGIVAFTCIQGFLNYAATYLNTWVGGKITNDLKMDLYKKLLTFNTAFFDKRKSGDIVFRFNTDADAACNGLLDNLKTFVSRLFSSLSLVCVLFYNSWQLALIASVVLGCAFLPLAKIRKRIKDVMDKSVAAGSTVITAYNETYAGNKTISSYNLKDYQEKKFANILSNIFTLKIKLIQRTSWLSPMMHVIVSVGIGLAIGAGMYVMGITATVLFLIGVEVLNYFFKGISLRSMIVEFSTSSQDSLKDISALFSSKNFIISSYDMEERTDVSGNRIYYVNMVVKAKNMNEEGILLMLLHDFPDITVHRIM